MLRSALIGARQQGGGKWGVPCCPVPAPPWTDVGRPGVVGKKWNGERISSPWISKLHRCGLDRHQAVGHGGARYLFRESTGTCSGKAIWNRPLNRRAVPVVLRVEPPGSNGRRRSSLVRRTPYRRCCWQTVQSRALRAREPIGSLAGH